MIRMRFAGSAIVAAGALALVGTTGTAEASDCSPKSVAGEWGFNMQSRDNTSPDFPQMAEPFAAVGIMYLKPSGRASIVLEIHAQGLENPGLSPFVLEADGQWTVDSSCFGQIDFVLEDNPPPEGETDTGEEDDIDMSFVAVEDASKLRVVWGFVTTAVDAERIR